jgi:hypothetical protein
VPLAKREKFRSDDFVNHVALQSSHRLSFGYHYDVLIWRYQLRWFPDDAIFLPRPSLMIPKIPAMLETRLVPKSVPSLSLRSPVGRSTTKVGADCAEGEVNA